MNKKEVKQFVDNMMADITNTQLIVDPPSGWKYGFPKPYFKNEIETETEVKNWLVENGYPQSEIDSLGNSFHIRCWQE
jgi:hypothetical protein